MDLSAETWVVRQAPGANSRDYDVHPKDAPASAGKIARVFGREGHHDRTVQRARLIAAAPDLLAALEKAVADYGREGGPWNVPTEPGTWIDMAKTAIRSARGRS